MSDHNAWPPRRGSYADHKQEFPEIVRRAEMTAIKRDDVIKLMNVIKIEIVQHDGDVVASNYAHFDREHVILTAGGGMQFLLRQRYDGDGMPDGFETECLHDDAPPNWGR